MAARECYLAMMTLDEQVQTMSIEERRFVAEPTEVLEDVPLEEGNPEKFTRIGTSMEEKTKQDLVQFLRENIVFLHGVMKICRGSIQMLSLTV